ncbi:hypothetical protein [Deinococcus radiodurans]|uniref:hypothetical protein n=2 Tax=Deinococcus radiodurans TaxID=1299 RepID=UPI0002E0D015|nr:hypothetical protein [Deinococcus radiodurans]
MAGAKRDIGPMMREPGENEGMFSALWTFLRELLLALIGQPSRPGPTRQEQEAELAQREALRGRQAPTSAWDAARQVGAEVGKAAIWQPTDAPRRKKKD